MSKYQDEILKLQYLRDRIIKSMVQVGNYPTAAVLEKRLSSVDSKLALFQYTPIMESDMFDVDKFNEDFMAIYQDLLILYKLTYQFVSEKYEQTKAFAEMHLKELENMADSYEKKSKFETSVTSLGKTVLFKTSGIITSTDNYVTTVDLGEVDVSIGSKVSFHIGGKNFEPADVTFKLGELSCSPYALAKEYLTIPGERDYIEYECELDESLVHSSRYIINNDAFDADPDNTYIVYGGKNMIYINGSNSEKYVEKQTNGFTLTGRGKISFYLIDASYISFNFCQLPVSQNFTGNTLNISKTHQKIIIEYEDTFAFDFTTDGSFYATKERGTVSEGDLYYPTSDNFYTFLIEEYTTQDTVTYDLSVEINQSSDQVPQVTMIAVKEYDDIEADLS